LTLQGSGSRVFNRRDPPMSNPRTAPFPDSQALPGTEARSALLPETIATRVTADETGLPHNQTSSRWVQKTAPGRRSVAVSPEDVVAGADPKLPVSLWAKAIAESWRGVAFSPLEKTPSRILSGVLREYIYDDGSVLWPFTKPLLYPFARLMLLYALWLQFSQGSGRNRRREERPGRRTRGPELTSAARSSSSRVISSSWATRGGEVVGHWADSSPGPGARRERHRLLSGAGLETFRFTFLWDATFVSI
jgi:hypothetical protein